MSKKTKKNKQTKKMNYCECIKRITNKVKKKHKKSLKVFKKLEYNATLDTPKKIVLMYQGVLKRGNNITDMQKKVAKRMVKHAKADIHKNNSKKRKHISKYELGLVRKYLKILRNEIIESC